MAERLRKGSKTKVMKYFLKISITALILIIVIYNCISQDIKDYSGEYVYKNDQYFESILLQANGQFIYERSQEFTKEKISGNWQIRNSRIILDSYPQRDRLLVHESFRKALKNKFVYVYNKQEEPIHYSLHYIMMSNDTIILKNQWEYSEMNSKAKSFYLVDNKGLSSPIYNIRGARSNIFKVLFETQKVFENESWDVHGNRIFPKNESGKVQKYSLIKKT